MPNHYPLHWPDNWPREKNPQSSRFKTTLAGALNNVEAELKRFANDSGKKIENLVISSNYTLGCQNPKDGGVAVYFTWDGLATCICVDRYKKIEENLQAIFHCIEAERTKLRHGGINLVRAAFRGYAALPPPVGDGGERWQWREVLGFDGKEAVSMEMVEKRYRELAQINHPDKGGDKDAFHRLTRARDQARREFGYVGG